MDLHVSQVADRTEIRLAGRLAINDVVDARQRLGMALRAGRPVVLETTGVTGIDTAGLQLLLAFCVTAHTRGLDVQWQQPSTTLRETAALLGLQTLLNLGEPH